MIGKKLLGVLVITLALGLKCFAQFNNVIPASPDAGTLAKFVNFPISYNSGVPNINIPLYEWKAGELILPVSLDYHAGGFKVNEQSGSVGLGWKISTDLQITVKINGISDLATQDGYIYNHLISSFPGGYGSNNTTDNETPDAQHAQFMGQFTNYENCFNMVTNRKDLQPDEFYYKMINKSGKFYFTPDGRIVTIPYNGVKIQYFLTPGGTGQFQITDTDGTVYWYGDGQPYENTLASELRSPARYDSPVSTWKCIRIISPSKVDQLEFVYRKGEIKSMFTSNDVIEFLSSKWYSFDQFNYGPPKNYDHPLIAGLAWMYDNGNYNCVKEKAPLYTLSNPKYFAYSGSDLGLNMKGPAYSWVNFPGIPSGATYTTNRTSKLDQIIYRAGNQDVSYMKYNYRNNYSNQLSSILISDLKSSQSIQLLQSSVSIPNYIDDLRPYNITYYLDSLVLPNSGKYRFYYHNKVVFTNHHAGSDAWGGINCLTYDILNKPAPNIKLLPYTMLVTENNGANTYTEIGSVDNLYGEILPKDIQVDTMVCKNGVLESIGYPTGGRTFFEFGPNYYQDATTGETVAAGGLRINSIKSYKIHSGMSGDNADLVKIYKYGKDENGTGLIRNRFEYSPNGVRVGYYYKQSRKYLEFSGSPDYPQMYYNVAQNDQKTTLLNSSMIDMFYSSGAPVYYTDVAEYEQVNGVITGKTVYKYVIPKKNCNFDIYNDSTTIQMRRETWNIGQLKSEVYFKKTLAGFDSIKSKTYDYTWFKYDEVPVIQAFQNNEYCDRKGDALLPEPGYDSPEKYTASYIGVSDFTIVDYGLPVGDMLKTRELERTMDGSTAIVKTTNYTYANWLMQGGMTFPTQLVKTETTLSDGKKLTDHLFYPQNYAAGTPFIDNLKSNYMLSSPIEKITTLDDKVIAGTVSTYYPDNTGHLEKTYALDPTKTLSLSNFYAIQNAQKPVFATDAAYEEKFLLSYSNNRLTNVIPKDNIPTSYYWGYKNTFPVVKAENVSTTTLNAAVDNALSTVGVSTIDNLTDQIDNLTTPFEKVLLKNFVTALKNSPLLANAQISVFSYSPLIGMTSQTDPKGMTIYYEYISSGRLKTIKDQFGNIIKSFEYHYAQ